MPFVYSCSPRGPEKRPQSMTLRGPEGSFISLSPFKSDFEPHPVGPAENVVPSSPRGTPESRSFRGAQKTLEGLEPTPPTHSGCLPHPPALRFAAVSEHFQGSRNPRQRKAPWCPGWHPWGHSVVSPLSSLLPGLCCGLCSDPGPSGTTGLLLTVPGNHSPSSSIAGFRVL